MLNVPVRSLGHIHPDNVTTLIHNFQSAQSRISASQPTQAMRAYPSSNTTVTAGRTVQAGPSRQPTAYGSAANTGASQGRGVEQLSAASMNARISRLREQGYPNEQIVQMLLQRYAARGYSPGQATAYVRQAMNQSNDDSDEESDEDDAEDDNEEEDSSEDEKQRNYPTRRAQVSPQVGATRQVAAGPQPSSEQRITRR